MPTDEELYNHISTFLETNFDRSDDIEILNEVYFKESSNMKEALNILSNILKESHKYPGTDSYFDKLSSTPEVIKFNRLMEKMFGFHTFALKIQKSQYVNAFTFPISFKLDSDISSGRKYIVQTKEGYKFNNVEYNTMVYVTSQLLADKAFNERDVMGVILHEIGHNFSFAINKGAGVFGYFGKISNLLNQIESYLYVWVYSADDNEYLANAMYNDPEESNFYKLAEHLKKKDNFMINAAALIMKPLAYIVYFGLQILLTVFPIMSLISILISFIHRNISPIGLMEQMYGYNDEKIADNFATIYGFGPEVAKFEEEIYSMNHLSSNRFLNTLVNMIILPFKILLYGGDPHPKHLARILDQINLLKIELEKEDLDPKMKAKIKRDITECEKSLDKFYKSTEKYGGKFNLYFHKLMEKLFGGDYRQLIMKTRKNASGYDDAGKRS